MDDIGIKYGHTPKPGEDSTTKRDAAMANVMNYLKEEEMDLYSESSEMPIETAVSKGVMESLQKFSPERHKQATELGLEEYLAGLDFNEERILPWTAATLEEHVTGPITRMIMGMSEDEYIMWHYNNFGKGSKVFKGDAGRKRMIRPPTRGK